MAEPQHFEPPVPRPHRQQVNADLHVQSASLDLCTPLASLCCELCNCSTG